jgi:hypothetical protein
MQKDPQSHAIILLLNFDTPSLQFKRLVRTAPGNLRKSADDLEEILL